MFSSYSYLGLIGHPEVNEAVCQAIKRFGAGCHGARLIAGTTRLHHELEAELAAFLGSEAAVLFNTGYVTNLATIAALVGPGDVVVAKIDLMVMHDLSSNFVMKVFENEMRAGKITDPSRIAFVFEIGRAHV